MENEKKTKIIVLLSTFGIDS